MPTPALREVAASQPKATKAGETTVWELSTKRNVRAELKIYGRLLDQDVEVLKRQFNRWLEGREDAAKNE